MKWEKKQKKMEFLSIKIEGLGVLKLKEKFNLLRLIAYLIDKLVIKQTSNAPETGFIARTTAIIKTPVNVWADV